MRRMAFVAIALGMLSWAGVAQSVKPEVLYMRLCENPITHRPTEFLCETWSTTFSTSIEELYCVVQVGIPLGTKRSSYKAYITWYTPGGEVYHRNEYEGLKQGYIWSLLSRIAVRDTRAATLPGTWRVIFSIPGEVTKILFFTLKPEEAGAPIPSPPPARHAAEPIKGREREPNDAPETANLLPSNELIQGEAKHFTALVYDDDWFEITPPEGDYRILLTLVGSPDELSTPEGHVLWPVKLFSAHDTKTPVWEHVIEPLPPPLLGFEHWELLDPERHLLVIEVTFTVRGGSRLYLLITARECSVVYSVSVEGKP